MDSKSVTTQLFVYREIIHRYPSGDCTYGQYVLAPQFSRADDRWEPIGVVDVRPIEEPKP